jgi:tRNA(fMet)-specific endonuclease VapC
MACQYLLDTNILTYLRSKKLPHLRNRFERLEAGEAGLSVITYGELVYGAEKSRDRDFAMHALHKFVQGFALLSLPDTAAETYGCIRAKLETGGRLIGSNDLWIAAHALAANLVLVTNNEREFRRVPGLKIENWARSP